MGPGVCCKKANHMAKRQKKKMEKEREYNLASLVLQSLALPTVKENP